MIIKFMVLSCHCEMLFVERFRQKMKSSPCCDGIGCWRMIVTSWNYDLEQHSTNCKKPRKSSTIMKGSFLDILSITRHVKFEHCKY